ncbi:MAG: penicillin-binding protein 1C [Pseudomonadota bacterium]
MRQYGLFGLVALLFLAAATRDAVDHWIDRTELPPVLAETSVEIRDRAGIALRYYPVEDGIWRLTPGEVDPGFVGMLIRYEDKRFHSHSGVDPMAMLRAAAQAIRHGRTVSGGSTLTMQVARLIEDGPTGRWAGKLRQMRVAWALERRLSKEQILSLYLTHAPYGGNLEGVRAASISWFGKEPKRLTDAQAALLIALPQAPEARRPDRYPERAEAARNRVLDRMMTQGVLDDGQLAAAMRERVPTRAGSFPRLAAHLADRARSEQPEQQVHDLTLDARVQSSLEHLITRAARTAGGQVSAALVAADHETGDILASVGSAEYDSDRLGFVDMTQAIRSPGSTLKPLIYGLAFDQGLVHPDTLIHDGPVMFGRYAPRNFDGRFHGDVRVRDSLQMSLNIPVVRLTESLGPARVLSAMKRSGARARLSGDVPGLAISLGGVGVTLTDLVQLYASLAQGGSRTDLRYRASDSNRAGQRVISDVAAWQVGNILAGLAPPPGARPGVLAYKTGTSYGHRDAWAIGYDGRHVIGVWMGRADGTPVPGAFGGNLAAPVLFEAFERLKPDFDPLAPPPPATLMPGAAELPQPLRRFRPRGSIAAAAGPGALQVVFPPDGSRISQAGDSVTLKLRGGTAPFTVLADGQPMATDLRLREFQLPSPGTGFANLVVLDSSGQSDRVSIRLD